MNIAVICSNLYSMAPETANGTSVFNYNLITNLAKRISPGVVEVTAFASGDSRLPVPVESVWPESLMSDAPLIASGWYFPYEQALIAKAFAMQDQFDVFHVNIGDGDIALPFVPFVRKPIIITIHSIRSEDRLRRFFDYYRANPYVFFVSASDAQRMLRPNLNYIATINHGIEAQDFAFNETGGDTLMWAGRAIPEKGLDLVVEAARSTQHAAKLFGIPRSEHAEWLQKNVLDVIERSDEPRISYSAGRNRHELIEHFQTSKAFILPVRCEETFGLVFAEAMSCGTPVIAFARGSIPEVIVDGVTGFIVNESDDDIRGNWIVTKTGVEGLKEAIERIYALPSEMYREMRLACRKRVLEHFTIERMVDNYLEVYKRVVR